MPPRLPSPSGRPPRTNRQAVKSDVAAGAQTETSELSATFRPNVKIADPSEGKKTVTETELKIIYAAYTPSGDPVTLVEACLDGRNTEGPETVLSANNDARVGIITIKLPRRDAIVSIVAHNKHGPSDPASIPGYLGGSRQRPQTEALHSRHWSKQLPRKESQPALPFEGCKRFVRTVTKGSALYETVITYPPRRRWTHDAVLDGLAWIRKEPTNRDVAMVFISGHGLVTSDQTYRFLPCDYDPSREERTAVRSLEFQDFFKKIGGKVVVFLDTCHAGDILGRRGKAGMPVRNEAFAEELATAGEGVVVFASSTGDQRSLEDEKWGNGAFTKALVEGLGGKADLMKVGVVRVSALEEYVSERVKELTEGKQKPMVAKPEMIENFPIVAVTRLRSMRRV
jgi:Caspase domain